MIRKLFYLILILTAVYFGYHMGAGGNQKKKESVVSLKETPQPNRDFPVREEKPFAIVVYSYKEARSCERLLKSIFEQEYDRFRVVFFDDASNDGTFEKVQAFVLDNKQEHRVILIRNQKRIGPVACLYRASENLLDQEIVIPIDAKDWLSYPKVLSRMNAVYQNPDVWLSFSGPIFYPSYEKVSLVAVENCPPPHIPVLFYAALIKQVRLADLLREGRFVSGRDAYLQPMLQMSGGRVRILNEPLFITNTARCRREAEDKPVSSYSPLAEFPSGQMKDENTDIVIFSCDRPMQLFACLESIERYLFGHAQISVICRCSDEHYGAGYEKVANSFPDVCFVFQGTKYKKDFKPLLLQTLFQSSSKYVLFGTDDQIVKDYADLKTCTEMMEKTGAYGFYLRLGSHITYSYQSAKDQPPPASIPIGKGIYAWNLKSGYCDWEFPHTVDMTIYRKSSLKISFEKMRYKTPNSLEFCWAKEFLPENEVGLYFEHSKVVNIPLNIVSRTGNPQMNALSTPELLSKFDQGLKIDIEPLYQIENASPHIEYYPEFVLR